MINLPQPPLPALLVPLCSSLAALKKFFTRLNSLSFYELNILSLLLPAWSCKNSSIHPCIDHAEYCQKYAKPEDVGAVPEEKSSDEELSEDEYDSSDDAVAGPVDP